MGEVVTIPAEFIQILSPPDGYDLVVTDKDGQVRVIGRWSPNPTAQPSTMQSFLKR